MKKDKLKKIHNSLKNKSINGYILIFGLLICSILISITFYNIGNTDGYYEKEKEFQNNNKIQLEKDLQELSVNEVKDIFLKHLMIKSMFWLPWILFALLIGWIIHGLF